MSLKLQRRMRSHTSPPGLTRGSIFLARLFRRRWIAPELGLASSSAALTITSRVYPTCGVKPGNDKETRQPDRKNSRPPIFRSYRAGAEYWHAPSAAPLTSVRADRENMARPAGYDS